MAAPAFVPAGSFLLGYPGDSTLFGAGFTETAFKQDFWRTTATAGAPTARTDHVAVWTGSKMIVWGGFDGARVATGGQYDPAADSWTATAIPGGPWPREVGRPPSGPARG